MGLGGGGAVCAVNELSKRDFLAYISSLFIRGWGR